MNRLEIRQRIRRESLNRVRKERFKTSAQMVERLGDGFSPSFLSQLLSGHRGIGDDVADKIEERLGLVSGYLDNDADGITAEFSWLYEHSSEEGKGFLRNSMRAVASLFLSPDGDRRKHSVPVLNDRRKSLK